MGNRDEGTFTARANAACSKNRISQAINIRYLKALRNPDSVLDIQIQLS